MAAAAHYVRHRGQVSGPYDTATLLVLARRGAVSRVHQISTGGGTWVAASKITELFGGPMRLGTGAMASDNDEPEWINRPTYADGGELGELASVAAEPTYAWVGPREPTRRFSASTTVAMVAIAICLLAAGIALTIYLFTRSQ